MDVKFEPLSADPLVSVIIPTYNSERYLAETLASVFSQTYKRLEIILVDDGSKDNTVGMLRGYEDRIVLATQPNRGPAAARNHGLRLAQGELICFLDSDDLWAPEKVQKQVTFLREHPEYGLLSTEMDTFDETGPLDTRVKAKIYNIKNGRVMQELLFGNWIQTSGVMVRRECIRAVGFFTEEKGLFGEDWILWMQIAARFPIYFMPEPLARIRQVRQSFSHHDPDAQFWSLFRGLEILQATIPGLQREPSLMDKAAARICFVRARKDAHQGNFTAARKKLRYALERRPMDARLWAMMVACASPAIWRIAHALKRRLGPPLTEPTA